MTNFLFRGNDTNHDKMLVGKAVCLKSIYKFSIQHFLVGSMNSTILVKLDKITHLKRPEIEFHINYLSKFKNAILLGSA